MITDHQQRFTVIYRMLQTLMFEQFTLAVGNYRIILDAVTRHRIFHQILGEQETFLAVWTLDLGNHIFVVWVERDRQVGRYGPGCGCPDQNRQRALAGVAGCNMQGVDERVFVDNRKFNVDSRGGFILVVDFRFGQCRPAIGTPVHWLVAPV